MFTGVANFNAKEGCGKCTVLGEFNDFTHTVVFPNFDCEKRTDEEFRRRAYGLHHRIKCHPILRLPIDMISQFPVGDELHLLHLGVMKRLLFGWRDGTFRKPGRKDKQGDDDTEDRRYKVCVARFSTETTMAISQYLLTCKLPLEFQRAPRSLHCLTHWKGTEYRTFLHYIGIVALKDHLIAEAYEHFLLLFCAVTICSTVQHFHHLKVAQMMLEEFIETYTDFYGVGYVTSNVHNLCHLVDEVELYGELQSFSAYKFENTLGKLKRMLRSGNRPLAQIAKRLMEDDTLTDYYDDYGVSKENDSRLSVKVSKRMQCDFSLEGLDTIDVIGDDGANIKCYSNVEINEKLALSATKHADRWFLTKASKIGRVMNVICISENEVMIRYSEYVSQNNFFTKPCDSRLLDIYSVECDSQSNIKIANIDCIKSKLVCLKYRVNTYVFVPLLHTK